MKLELVMLGIILIQAVICFFIKRMLDKQLKENKKLKGEIEVHVSNIKVIKEWAEKLNELKKKRKDRKNEIDKAKTDEEIYAVVNSIIADNNKLCDKD